MAEFDEAENARAALRALWSMSGQMDSADSLGKEQEASCHPAPQDQGTSFMAHGGEEDSGVGFAAFQESNEPTFDRGEAARKFRDAWKSQLAMDGKIGSNKPLSESASKTPQE